MKQNKQNSSLLAFITIVAAPYAAVADDEAPPEVNAVSDVVAEKVCLDSMRRVCSDDNFAEIVIRDMGRSMSCNIGDIERVESKEAAKAIVAEREQARNEE